jgi:hypothetical protein
MGPSSVSPQSPRSSRASGPTDFNIKPVGNDAVIKFSLDGKIQMALWSKVSEEESWADEWVRVCTHIAQSLGLSEIPTMEMYYVDDDRDEIILSVFI